MKYKIFALFISVFVFSIACTNKNDKQDKNIQNIVENEINYDNKNSQIQKNDETYQEDYHYFYDYDIYYYDYEEEDEDLKSVFNRQYLENLYESRFFHSEREAKKGIEYFILAQDFYKENNYEESIANYILAIKNDRTALGLYYYNLGVCLMVSDNLKTAKKSFLEAIYHFFIANDYTDDYSFFYLHEDLFSFDNNGVMRETYYSYYNIACIESLQNNVDAAFAYLCLALFHGYPYINHIKNDDDLYNLFIDKNKLKKIEEIFNAGSQNTVLGKIFDLNIKGGYTRYVNFKDKNILEYYTIHENGDGYETADYSVKNYLVFSEALRYAYRENNFKYIKRFEGSYRNGKNYIELSIKKFYEK